MGLQCPDGAQKARAPALPGARVVALTSPSSSSHRSPFPPFHSKDKKKMKQTKKHNIFLTLLSLTPSSPHPRVSIATAAALLCFFSFLFFPADLFFRCCCFFCPLVSSTVCHVSATKQRNQSASRRAEGRGRVGGVSSF